MTGRKWAASAGTLSCLLIAFVLLAMMAWAARTRAFDPDEFQHVEFAWLIARGTIPYRDVFEHHTPVYHLLVAPLLSSDAILSNGNAAVSAVLGLRFLGVALCALILFLTGIIMHRVGGLIASLSAVVVLASSGIFALKGLEIRPDQLACSLLLCASLALIHGRFSRTLSLSALLAGVFAALAILTTQKIVFALPGLAITFAIVCIERGATRKQVVRALAAGAAGGVLASLPLLAWLAAHDALSLFFHDNFFLGARWTHNSRPLVLALAGLGRDETLILFLAALGTLSILRKPWREARWPLAIVAPMGSMVALMPLFPVVQTQYIFLFLPYLAMLAGLGIVFIVDATQSRTVAALVVGLVALHGALTIKTQSTAHETKALAVLRYTVEQTPVDATVLRSWSVGMVFRKPAFRYFSLHPEIRSIVAPPEMARLAAGLRSGAIAPKLIEMDDAMRQMPSPVVSALVAGWEPTGIDTVWRRKPGPPR